jgi:hypothetical protein
LFTNKAACGKYKKIHYFKNQIKRRKIMSDSGYIRLITSQVPDKKVELNGLEEMLDD